MFTFYFHCSSLKCRARLGRHMAFFNYSQLNPVAAVFCNDELLWSLPRFREWVLIYKSSQAPGMGLLKNENTLFCLNFWWNFFGIWGINMLHQLWVIDSEGSGLSSPIFFLLSLCLVSFFYFSIPSPSTQKTDHLSFRAGRRRDPAMMTLKEKSH